MADTSSVAYGNLAGRARRLQLLTVAWMAVEAVVSLAAAWTAKSPALGGFGGDSVIELASGIVVLRRFSKTNGTAGLNEKTAARIAGGLLFCVAIFIGASSTFALLGYYEPRPTVIGIALLSVAALGMPWLAHEKRKLAASLSSPALKADAAESSLCGYLSWIALTGLVANAVFRASWADPIAALLLLPLVVREGWQAVHASGLGCGCD